MNLSHHRALKANKDAVLAIVLISYVMIVLDISVVLTGLPKIQDELGFSAENLAWVQSAYTLTFGGFMLLGARAGDLLGRRKMFVTGMSVFTLASLAIGISQTPSWMLGWRAVQGAGAAVLAPSTLALLQINFAEGHERTRAVSYYAAAAGVSATVGLVLGGVLAEWISWRAGFYLNLPIGVLLVIGAYRYIDETTKHDGRFDFLGAATSILGIGSLVFGFIHSAHGGWSNSITIFSLAIAVLLICLFVIIERRAIYPILPLDLFASRARSGAYAARVLYLGSMVGFFFFSTLYLQDVKGYGPAECGLAFIPATILHVPCAIAVPRLVKYFNPNRLMISGIAIGIVGMAWLSFLSAESPYLSSIALPMLLIGISQGFTLSPLTSAGVAGVDQQKAGAASGAVNVAHQIGSSVGLSVLIAVAGVATAGLTGRAYSMTRIQIAFDAGTVMLALALVVVLTTIVRPEAMKAIPKERATRSN